MPCSRLHIGCELVSEEQQSGQEKGQVTLLKAPLLNSKQPRTHMVLAMRRGNKTQGRLRLSR
ncbi:hypothetical protein ACKKBG_A26205 [Auxenochlorella protothecoides x Auxenochlorella symbiontica]